MRSVHREAWTIPVLSELEAVLFDMDGTLVDSHAVVERTWCDWAEANGVDPALVLATCHGSPAETTVRRYRPDLDDVGVAAHVARLAERECAEVAGVVACEGALDAVDAVAAAGIPWAVVTSANGLLARARLRAAGLEEPPLLITVTDVSRGKPHPEPFLQAARGLHVRIEDCLAVEDSAPGVESAQRSGAHVLVVGPDAASLADVARHWGGSRSRSLGKRWSLG